MSLFRRQIDPDPLDVRKAAIEDQMIAESEEREELRQKLCEALGFAPPFPPLCANLIATAKAKLLTTDELRNKYCFHMRLQAPPGARILESKLICDLEWALTQSTEVQQGRALLEAIR